jgi:hypothetical protein
LRLLDEEAHLAFGVGPSHPLADEDERPGLKALLTLPLDKE